MQTQEVSEYMRIEVMPFKKKNFYSLMLDNTEWGVFQ